MLIKCRIGTMKKQGNEPIAASIAESAAVLTRIAVALRVRLGAVRATLHGNAFGGAKNLAVSCRLAG
jgi:hypothetical protein